VRWESFFTHGDATAYGEDEVIPDAASACCAPAIATVEPAPVRPACC
jgi:hypothetical protein